MALTYAEVGRTSGPIDERTHAYEDFSLRADVEIPLISLGYRIFPSLPDCCLRSQLNLFNRSVCI